MEEKKKRRQDQVKFLPREKLRELSLNPSWDDSQIPAWVTCVTRYVEPLFRNASKVSPLPVAYTHTVTTPGPSLHCQPNTTIDSFFSFSFLFFPIFFSSFLCFFDVQKREHRGFPNTMRRNWKSPDAENWSFPMIREFIELDSRIVRISLPFLVNYNFKSESVTITLRIVYADSYLWEIWFKEVENLSRWNVEQCSQKTLRVPRDEISTRRRKFMR